MSTGCTRHESRIGCGLHADAARPDGPSTLRPAAHIDYAIAGTAQRASRSRSSTQGIARAALLE